jgi:hypothetical protein
MATRHAADEAAIRRRIGELVAAVSAMDFDGLTGWREPRTVRPKDL